ncbi:thiamine pyrophosphate-dependent dehydrogenase E1 component subunit alpha [Caldisericum exile]|uniref:Acetoin dehydrogenase E1 component alpha subunit n=1 Tax=Caldisericum exile (strain DSM 21853 / NBRC 104410 / AZM16c01) TaxID=511051 RepID=A0A7U6JFC9_CALEA|nr:thiamine pyrophosphate-dependent dehydrogenase E1 component subunit alpha [Caldisericum exile]BAL80299.1 acetoin dehydrogenase E1 component alpha subunit [Caldisericum exile AZM16c01]
MELSKELLLKFYKDMVRIRNFELKAEELFLQGKLPGFIHLYIGEEAIAVGAMANLRVEDYITSTHRGHGHMLAKGASMRKMMAELYGKKHGYCKGKGGSMHIADVSIGVLGANGEVGGGLPIAVGAGMAIKLQKKDSVVISFFGDGASNRGAFHEALNWASVFKLPVIFLNENNQFASTERVQETTSVENISDRAVGYNMPGVSIDGNDVIAVFETVKEAVERARNGGGPTLIEAKTYRLKGHFVGDPQLYRTKEEVDLKWPNEPISRFEKKLFEGGYLTEKEKEEIWNDAKNEVEDAVLFAEQDEYPAPEEALEDLFEDSTNCLY